MNFELNVILSFSIALAVLISWIRFKRLHPAYYPFIFLLWLGLINEIVSYIIIGKGLSNAVTYNIYSLIEVLLIIWQFKLWRLFNRNVRLYPIMLTLIIVMWVVEILFFGSLYSFNSYFLITSSFILVLMSIAMINQLLARVQESLLRSSIFLVCLGFVFYFTYSVLVEAFWIYGLTENQIFVTNIYTILIYVNLFTNLLYAFAVLWMPTKPKYLLQS